MEDREIIELYWQRDEEAIRQSERKYGRYCFAIAERILHDVMESEECVNDTWLRSWNVIPPQRPNILKMFFAKITRNLAFNRYEAAHAQKRGRDSIEASLSELEEVVGVPSNIQQDFDLQQLTRSIVDFLETVSRKDRVIFLHRYFYAEELKEIAKAVNLNEHAISVSLSRTRSKLKTWLKKEGWL